jgi:hypothetical protein
MATTGTGYNDLKTQVAGELVGVSAAKNLQGGFINLTESDFPNLPAGACVCVRSVSYSKLQAGDYTLISCDGKVQPRRFIKLVLTGQTTRLLVCDGAGAQEEVAFGRLLGLITRVKTDGAPFDPNPRGFFQRVAFKLRHSFARSA